MRPCGIGATEPCFPSVASCTVYPRWKTVVISDPRHRPDPGTQRRRCALFAAPLTDQAAPTVIRTHLSPEVIRHDRTAPVTLTAHVSGRTGQTFKSGGPNRVCRLDGSPETNPSTGLRRGPNLVPHVRPAPHRSKGCTTDVSCRTTATTATSPPTPCMRR